VAEAAPRGARAARSGRAMAQAVVSGAILLGLAAAAFVLGAPALFTLVAAVALIALYELLNALRRAGRRPVVGAGIAGGLVVLVAAYRGGPGWVAAAGGVTVLGALALALRPGRGPTPAGDAAWTVLGVAWIAGGAAAAVGLLRVDPGGAAVTTSFLVVVAAGDVAAFFVGRRWGRRRLAPSLSPGKSWEGLGAGLVASLLAGACAGGLLAPLSTLEGLGLGLLCGVFGPVGDLVESAVKREIGVKDSSGLLPGHGGFLDRIDAMIFCAPLALAYVAVLGA
jgi:phosphatidate cytidylyltransferase